MVRTWISETHRGHGIMKIIEHVGGGTNFNTKVVGSITEMTVHQNTPFIGDDAIGILSIAPQANGNVNLKVSITWDNDLDFRITLFLDPIFSIKYIFIIFLIPKIRISLQFPSNRLQLTSSRDYTF